MRRLVIGLMFFWVIIEPKAQGGYLILNELNLGDPALAAVKTAVATPNLAATELLAFYRQRTSAKHPSDTIKITLRTLDTSVLNAADDALKNTLITSPKYPRFAFGETIDWLTNRAPNRDIEWLVQLNRHDSWGALSQAYAATGHEKYAQCYVRQLTGWMAQCPVDIQSDAWRTIEAGIRGKAWTFHFLRFVHSPAYTPDLLMLQLRSFHNHARRLDEILAFRQTDSVRGLKGNWALMEAEGLAFIAVTFPEFKESSAWLERSAKVLLRAMGDQVRPDGHQREQCLGYHLGAIAWFSATPELLALNGKGNIFPPVYWKHIEAMCEVPLKLGLPDGSNTQFGDDHSQFNFRKTLEKWAPVFKREDFLYAATGGKKGLAPGETAYSLPASGFYSLRSGWTADATMLVLKCGPDGGWHDQSDNGTFEIFAGGRRLTPDSGPYIYSGDDEGRKWFKQSRVHQTLTLDGRDIARAPRLRYFKPGASLDILSVENESYEKTTHRRTLFFVDKKYFVVVDELMGRPQGNAWLHFQLAPGKALFDANALSARTGFENGVNLLILAMPQPGLALTEEEGRVSFKYGTQEPRPAFRFELKDVRSPIHFVTLLVPYAGKSPETGVALQTPNEKEGLTLDVTVNGRTTRLSTALAQ